MRNLADELAAILDEGLAVQEGAGLRGALEGRAPEIRRMLSRYAPELMLYGVYNAGKSTLINAMLGDGGREIAPTSDAPCTAKVTPYRLGGYVIYDTPGLDAPIEHERVSRAQLERCDAVLFVVSDDGNFEEKEVLAELRRIRDLGKALLVLINSKNGADPTSPVVEGIVKSILGHLGGGCDAGSQPSPKVLFVNAKVALKAKSDGNAKRYEGSGAAAVEESILRTLAGIHGDALLLPAAQALEAGLADVAAGLGAGDKSGALARVEKASRLVRESKARFVGSVEVDVKGKRGGLADALEGAIASGSEEAVSTELENFLGMVEAFVEARLGPAIAELGREVAEALPPIQVDVKAAKVASATVGSKEWFAQVDLTKMAQAIQSKAGVESIKKGLLALRGMKFPGLKGRWESTLGKWAGRAAKGIGVFLQLGSVVLELRAAFKAQREAEAQAAAQAKRLRAAAESTADQVEADVLAQLPTVARQVFEPIESRVDGELVALKGANAQNAKAVASIRVLQDRLSGLIAEVRSAKPGHVT